MQATDIVVIGAGPVGIFSVFQSGILGMRSIVIDSLELIGGQCIALYPEKPIYDIPSQPKITAADLITQLRKQAEPFNPLYFLNQSVIKIDKIQERFLVTTSAGNVIESKVVFIAAGAGMFGPKKPPLPNIETFEGKSVFYSVKTREDFFGKTIVIAGGGDSAIDWAISLSEIAQKIYLVHRRDKFRAALDNVRKVYELSEKGKIELMIGYQLSNLTGQNGHLESIALKDFSNNTKIINANILLPFFGLAQNLGPISTFGLDIKSHCINVSPTSCQTNITGIYAMGDIATYPGKLKLILTGFAEAASSAHHAYSKVFDGKPLHFQYSTTTGVPN